MKGFKLIITFLFLIQCVNAQYWFQSGARGGESTQFNNGAAVTIQTFTDRLTMSGSIGFWVGENLQNGGFVQVGYVIENQSGRYPSYCDTDGCSAYQYIAAGSPEWFYEYFPPGENNNFLGAVGPNDSAGKNGTLNNYGFYSNGEVWYFTMNGKVLGSVNMGTNTSGYNDAVAFGEVANASNTNTDVPPTKFYNLSIFRQGEWSPAPTGYSYIGYGVGSLTELQNPYGVEEIGSRANAFEVGTGLPEPQNNVPLWQTSYLLSIASRYGNITSSVPYIGYRSVEINAPSYVYTANYTREVFTGWSGDGAGSYSGTSINSSVSMYSNITEVANWQTQYFVNISSNYGYASGTGWYPAGTMVHYSMNPSIVYQNSTSRAVFSGWRNGTTGPNGTLSVSAPVHINAIWVNGYLVNASSQYGNVTGSGWYPANSTATVTISSPYRTESRGMRLAFYSWSDGNTSQSHTILVDRPYAINAIYKNQSLVGLYGVDQQGLPVNIQGFYIGNSTPGTSAYLFNGYNYTVTGAVYKDTYLTISQIIKTGMPDNISISLPLYNVNIVATDVFGIPLSIPVNVTFLNGTTRTVQLSGGESTLDDVPYGKLSVSARYLGLVLSSSAQYGSEARITTISAMDFVVIIAIVIIAFIMYMLISIRYLHHAHNTSKYGPNQ